MLMVYLIWITIGTAFYAAGSMDLGFCRGYYMCVNVGYSIGWGYPVETMDSEFFFGTYHGNFYLIFPSCCIVYPCVEYMYMQIFHSNAHNLMV